MSTRDIGNNLLRPGIDTEQQVRTKLLGTSVRVPWTGFEQGLGRGGKPSFAKYACHTHREIHSLCCGYIHLCLLSVFFFPL